MADQPDTAPGPQGRQIDLKRVLDKVQADPTGALLVQAAVQSCVIEDQDALIAQLRAELVAATSAGAGRPAGGPVAGDR